MEQAKFEMRKEEKQGSCYLTSKHAGLHGKTGFHGKSTKGADGRGARMRTSVLDLALGISRSRVNTASEHTTGYT